MRRADVIARAKIQIESWGSSTWVTYENGALKLAYPSTTFTTVKGYFSSVYKLTTPVEVVRSEDAPMCKVGLQNRREIVRGHDLFSECRRARFARAVVDAGNAED